MGRLAGFKYRQIVKRLKQLGFVFDRQAAGRHEIWYNPGTDHYTTIPIQRLTTILRRSYIFQLEIVMSTKCTLAHGDTFHFYSEVLDEHYVYLRLEGVEYEANYNRVMAYSSAVRKLLKQYFQMVERKGLKWRQQKIKLRRALKSFLPLEFEITIDGEVLVTF